MRFESVAADWLKAGLLNASEHQLEPELELRLRVGVAAEDVCDRARSSGMPGRGNWRTSTAQPGAPVSSANADPNA